MIIDTHTHFYDPGRPEGVPWPPRDDIVLHRPVLPGEWEELVQPFGVTGTVVVEASPWVEDNPWLLDVAGQPGISPQGPKLAWRDAIAEAAERPNVFLRSFREFCGCGAPGGDAPATSPGYGSKRRHGCRSAADMQ